MGAIDTYLHTPSARRRRVPPPVVSPDTYLATPSAVPSSANTGLASPVTSNPTASIASIMAEAEPEPRFPVPTQRRGLDARQGRPRPGPSERAIERFLVDTDQPAGRDDPSPLDLEGVNPVLLRQAVRLGRATEPLAVTSGARTLADQRVLYNRSQAGGSMAAPPSPTAPHVQGRALDVELTPEQRGMLGRFGLGTPVAGDEPHVELTDPRLQRRAEAIGGAPRAARPAGARVAVPEIVPPQFRRAVATQGQRLNEPLQEAGVNMSGPEYLAKLIQFESGWSPTAENPSSAFGLGQFIDSTAADFRDRLGVETQDPSRPRQMIKGAAMHASGDFDYSPLYGGYNPGYSDTDPIPAVESGRNVDVRVPRRRVERLSEGVDAPQAMAAPQQMSGQYAGSKRALRQLLGPYAQTEDWQDKEPGHSAGGLHDPANEVGYAGDLSTSEDLIDYVAKKLERQNPGFSGDVDYGQTGLESGLQFKGYDVEWLPYTHGSGPHDHLGLEWTGGTLPEGTFAGGPVSAGGTSTSIPSAGGAPAITEQGLGPYADLVNRQLGQIRRQDQRSALLPTAPTPDARRSMNPEEDEDEEENLAAMLGDRFRPQRRLVF